MTTERDPNEWRALSELDDGARESAMREWFEELLAMPADSRSERVEAMLLAEQELDDDAFAAMTLSRLRTWTRFEPEQTHELASSLLAARQRLPGDAAMRSVVTVQTVIRELPMEETGRLIQAAPSVRDALPEDMLKSLDAMARPETAAAVGEVETTPKKRFWQFWRR